MAGYVESGEQGDVGHAYGEKVEPELGAWNPSLFSQRISWHNMQKSSSLQKSVDTKRTVRASLVGVPIPADLRKGLQPP